MREIVAIVTPSFRADFFALEKLCKSIDRFFLDDFEHFIIVPSCDLKLFKPLQSTRRRIISKESLLSNAGFWRIPIPVVAKSFGRTIRIKEQWFVWGVGRISGWIVQQIIKLSAPQLTNARICLFIDSDILMVREFSVGEMMRDNTLYLNEHSRGLERPAQQEWLAGARRLLQLNDCPKPVANYIGPFIPWDTSVVSSLQAYLTKVNGIDWRIAVAKEESLSEYILYGLYSREVLGEKTPHCYGDLGKFTHTLWLDTDQRGFDHYASRLTREHAAVCIQSAIPISNSNRMRLIETMISARDSKR